MAFYLSPAVYVREKDLTTSIPALASNITAFAGNFTFGPAFKRELISSEQQLVDIFKKPSLSNNEDFLMGSSFLAYANTLYVVRVVGATDAKNSGLGIKVDGTTTTITNDYIANEDDVTNGNYTPSFSTDEAIKFVAKYPGVYGNKIGISLSDPIGFYDDVLPISGETGTFVIGETVTGGTSSATGVIAKVFSDGLVLTTITGTFSANETITGGTSSATATVAGALTNHAEVMPGVAFSEVFDFIPEEGQYALVVTVDGEIAEKYFVSFTPGTLDVTGTNIYIEDLLLNQSNYILAFIDTTKTLALSKIDYNVFAGGNDGTVSDTDFETAYDLFANTDEIDVNIIMEPANVSTQLQQYIIDNVVEKRKDCVALLNVPKINIIGKDMPTATDAINTYINNTLERSTSYAAVYPNYKYTYDRYNKKFIWCNIIGDIAGDYAYNDMVADPWFAPAGYNRGKMKNVAKLAYNPDKTNRDILYKNNVNPVIMDKEGAIIFGQKTLLRNPSAFNRVNVRRLFITIEKAIATSLKYFLFEQNTDYTRRQVISMIIPYLRNIQGRQGIYDFTVQCDENNNTPEIIDLNQLNVDLYIKPSRTIEFIQLTAIAVKTGVKFEEITQNLA